MGHISLRKPDDFVYQGSLFYTLVWTDKNIDMGLPTDREQSIKPGLNNKNVSNKKSNLLNFDFLNIKTEIEHHRNKILVNVYKLFITDL